MVKIKGLTFFNMTKKLFFQAIVKFLLGVVIVGLLVFLPAGTLNFFNGWLFLGVLFVPMLGAGVVMMIKNPKLLQERLNAKETQKEQGAVIKLSALMFIAGFVLAGLDYRFSWLQLPTWIPFVAAVLFLGAYLLWAEVLRENAYLARTIKVEDGQKVVDTGLYSIVRHPMYAATLILFLSMPFVLGSLIAFIPFLAYPVLIGARIVNEEKFLTANLDGYAEYKSKVKYRLIPFVW